MEILLIFSLLLCCMRKVTKFHDRHICSTLRCDYALVSGVQHMSLTTRDQIIRDLNKRKLIICDFNVIILFLSKMKWTEHEGQMGELRNAYRILVGKPEGKRPLGRQRRK
jgi:hypothetical protein